MTTDLMKPESNGDLTVTGEGSLDRNPAAVYLASLANGSRRGQRQALNRMAGILTGSDRADCLALSWQALSYQHTAALRAQLLDLYRPATVNKFLSALRGVLKEAWRLGLMSGEDYQRAADLESVKGETLPAGRGLTPGEILALMASCEKDSSPAGARDAAIIGLMYAAGLRREEVINLDLVHYEPESGCLTIYGKRAKERTDYVTNGAADALSDWLSLRGSTAGPLFLAVSKGDKIDPQAKRITPQAIYNMLAKRAKAAGVAKFSPHDLRRSFVSDLLDKGVDIATVARMAGHANVQTTARYDRRPEQAKQKAAGLLHIPYHKRGSENRTKVTSHLLIERRLR
jgi:site-specific recombinase XerD